MHFRSTVGLLSFAGLLAAALTVGLGAQLPQLVAVGQTSPPEMSPAGATDETPELWFVELNSPPAVEGTSLAMLDAEKAAFRRAAARGGLRFLERFSFSNLFNGFSLRIDRSQLALLSRLAGVKAIYPVDTIAAPPPATPGDVADPDLLTSLAMIGADVAQSELGYTGKNVRVAVVDTGIDYDHPDLGGDGSAQSNSTAFPTGRVITGWDFVGDAFNADSASASYNPVPVPDAYPDDCGGHGSHVAGIIGANGSVKGVAPDVSLGAYRVFGCQGSTTADIMIAAMERALSDDMQVLNMSIGSGYQWPEYPTAMAATRLVNRGIVVVASIGNSGANGLYAAGAPGLGEKVIGVASYDNTYVAQAAFAITPDSKLIGYNPATGAPPAPISGTLSIAAPTPVTACPTLVSGHYVSPFAPGSLAGKAVLVNRGTCSFYWKARFAQEAGAAAVIIANNTAGQLSPTVATSGGAAFTPIPCPHADFPACPAIAVPTVAILQTDGTTIRDRVASGVVLTWTAQTVSAVNPTGGLVSSFSSYGLSPDLTLKPDIGAPGGSIWSTYPIELGSYASLGGTSMSSPHVAGAAALYLQAHPLTPSQAMRGILQNSAAPKNWWGNPGLGFLDNVHRQGAGMLQIDRAILSTIRIEPAKISAGEGQMGPYTETLTVKNKGATNVTYNLSYINALSTGGTITPSFFASDATVAFSTPGITVPAAGTASVTATINAATGPVNGQYGGYIVFTPQGGGQVYRVPFAGFVGDYQSVQVLTPTGNGFPWLAVRSGGSYYRVTDPADWTYTMAGGDVPYFLVHLEHQSRLFRVAVYSEKGKAWHRAYNEEFLPRNSSSTSFFAFPFDGATIAGTRTYTVPDGRYYATISVLKALGDAANPADWETWTSPIFVIDR